MTGTAWLLSSRVMILRTDTQATCLYSQTTCLICQVACLTWQAVLMENQAVPVENALAQSLAVGLLAAGRAVVDGVSAGGGARRLPHPPARASFRVQPPAAWCRP